MDKTNRKRVAILATNGFEESELRDPRKALREADCEVHIVSDQSGTIKSWSGKNWSESYNVDRTLDEADASDYNALVLPGGLFNPDTLRRNKKAVNFVKQFFTDHKPVAAICHGPWLLAEAGVLQGRTITSYPSIQTDMRNAGANWVDREVVVDEGLVTSRSPEDMDAFTSKLVEEVYEGKHELQTA